MGRKKVVKSDHSQFGRRAVKLRPKKKAAHGSGHQHGHGSIRTANYKGFEIEIETNYKFKVDGKPLMIHAHVLDSGHVHSPALPNYGWTSAVEFVRQLIDSFPDDFVASPKSKSKKKTGKKSHPKKAKKKKGGKQESSKKKKPAKKKKKPAKRKSSGKKRGK